MFSETFETELKNSRGGVRKFTVRRCGITDLTAIADVQDRVIASLENGDIFARTSVEQIEESLREDICIGAFSDEGLAAATIMVVNRITPRNLGVYLGYGDERLLRCATYDSTFVLPEFRGYGLQRLFCTLRDEAALELGCDEALATVSPDNPVSLGNMRANGFEILTEKNMYSGVRRYIVGKKLDVQQGERSSR